MNVKKKGIYLLPVIALLAAGFIADGQKQPKNIIQFIFTSDVHFGLTRKNFRGKKNVPSVIVNAAMIKQMNAMPALILPDDGGVNARQEVKGIEAVMITGDLANREETGIQSASLSWTEFIRDYTGLLHLKTATNKRTRLLITPGNHDVSNAIGFRKPMLPLRDASSMIGIYNLMMHPAAKKNKTNYHYQADKVHYSINLGSIHCMFINLWPDSAERIWMAKDLAKVNNSSPVFLFTHSMPDVEARFFINPNGKHDINDTDKFENLVSENFKDGDSITNIALREQRGLAAFLKLRPNIKAYFHGHSNYTEFYDWKGPDNDIVLHCFRADSPMKGKYSAKDETKLSYELVTVNTKTKQLTVRECFWNKEPANPLHHLEWGSSITIAF